MDGSFLADLGLSLTLTLLHVLWIGFVIAVVDTAVAWGLRRQAARVRYAVHVGALMLLAISLPATLAIVAAGQPVSRSSADPAAIVLTPPGVVAGDAADPRAARRLQESLAHQEERLTSGADGIEPLPGDDHAAWQLVRVAPYVAVAYLLGVVVMLSRLGIALWSGRRLRLAGTPAVDPDLLAMAARQAQRIGLRLVPMIAWCTRVTVPVVVGIIKPTLLLPASLATGLDAAQLELLLAHELAHVRRFDLWINLLQRLVEAVLFFHPAMWYLSRRVSTEREKACDDLVLRAGAGRVQYAEALLRMAEIAFEIRGAGFPGQAVTVAATGENPSQFKQRILRLLDAEATPRPHCTARSLALTLLIGGSLMTWLAVFHARAQSSQPQADNEQRDEPRSDDGWGPIVDGLQARVTLHDGSSAFRPGDVLCLDLWVRNTTDKPAAVSLRNPVEWQWTLQDRELQVRGEDRPVRRGDWLTYYEIKPGETILLLRKRPRMLIQPADWKGKPQDFALPVVTLTAGASQVLATDIHVMKAQTVSEYAPIVLPTGRIPIEVQPTDQPRPPVRGRVTESLVRIAWGDAVEGIQAGIAWAADDELNRDEDSCELFFRNTSDRELAFGYMAPPWDSWFVFGTDRGGKPYPAGERLAGLLRAGDMALKPGEVKRFATPHTADRNMRPSVFPEDAGLIGRGGNVGFPNADGSNAYGIELKTGLLDFRNWVRAVVPEGPPKVEKPKPDEPTAEANHG